MKLCLLLLLVAGSALAADSDVLQCRTLQDGVQRLACYDAMAVGVAHAAPTRKAMEQGFGLAEKRPALDVIESTIVGKFDGWGPDQLITLANGQVWRVSDDSSGVVYGTDLKVQVERSALGAMTLVIAGSNKAPRVKRVR